MSFTWSDINRIAEELFDTHSTVDPKTIRFTDLHKWVCQLPEFNGDPKRSNEKILEAIQQAWIDEI